MARPTLHPADKKHHRGIRIRGKDLSRLLSRYGSIQKFIDLAVADDYFRLNPMKPRKDKK